MPRNTLLFTMLLAVVAATLVGFNVGKKFQQPSSITPPTPSPTGVPVALETFTSECGITFQYPGALDKLDSASGSAVFTDPTNEANSIAVTCQADIPRPPLLAANIESVALLPATGTATISARLYHDASAKDGTPIDKLIFTHPKTGLDVFVAGFGDVFEGILATIRVL